MDETLSKYLLLNKLGLLSYQNVEHADRNLCSPIDKFGEKIVDEASACSETESNKNDYDTRIDHLNRELDLQKSSIIDMVDFRKKYATIQQQCIIQKEEYEATVEYLNEQHEKELLRVKND